ncbi:MAG: hypothetical protein JO243_00855 [Solirubrobacterales bacterium]|nr:hypothetical protein [Solirubrobacterales bacterium]
MRDYGTQAVADLEVFGRAEQEERVVVSADTDLGTLPDASEMPVPRAKQACAAHPWVSRIGVAPPSLGVVPRGLGPACSRAARACRRGGDPDPARWVRRRALSSRND